MSFVKKKLSRSIVQKKAHITLINMLNSFNEEDQLCAYLTYFCMFFTNCILFQVVKQVFTQLTKIFRV